MCIIHKGFRDFRALSHVLNLACNLIGLKSEIPYEIIYQPFTCHFYPSQIQQGLCKSLKFEKV